jgi:hypothetical protein
MTSQRCTRRSLPNYLAMTSFHWNVRQNILTWRWWMNDKIKWRHVRIVPTLFLPLFHLMSIILGTVCFLLFFSFLSAERFFQIRVTGLKFSKRFFSSTVNISFARDGYLWPKVTLPLFQLFVSWTFFFKYALLVWNLTKDFFRVP